MTSTGVGSNELFFRFSNQANVATSLLDGDRDQARSELMKQEHKVESRNTCIRELQQQLCARRLELEDAHVGYEESRREQVRLHEELVIKEKALRDTQIRSIHEMQELRRAQELRVDGFSVQKLRESHDTIQKLTSQIQELQERVNCMNDSGEFQDIESNCSGKILTFPVNWQSFQVADLFSAATEACHLIHGICLKHRESCVRFNTDTLSRNSSLYESKCHRCDPSAEKYRETCRGR